MRVHAGSIILEPGLNETDFAELAKHGVWLAKAGFGAFATPYDYAPYVAMAKHHGMVTMVHTGGSSIPGSAGIWADHVLKMQPDVSYHVNGGPIAMPDADFPRLVNESDLAHAGLHRRQFTHDIAGRQAARDGRPGTAAAHCDRHPDRQRHHAARYALHHEPSRVARGVAPEIAVAMATGNNARVYRLNGGALAAGRDADIVLVDACLGGSQSDALSALRNGDIWAWAQ